MNRCPQCQHENPPGARFCNGCGARVELACAGCGQVNPSGSRFCNGCGAKLGDPAPAGPEPRFTSPESYTPKHLAAKIMTSKASLEGERKHVTVLFADLKGSLELLADRDPEEARNILDPVLERMMEAVHRYEGTVNQVMGDGIMALFGAPLAHEDHAVRACYAALRMQESLKRYADDTRREHGVEVQIRVRLNSGEVVVGSVGSDLRMDYTAVGQTTHLAARMEQLATRGTVRLTAETVRLAEGYVEVRSLGPIPVNQRALRPLSVQPLGSNDWIYITTSRGNPEHWGRLMRLMGREELIDDPRFATGAARVKHEAEVDAIVTEWTRRHTKEEAMALISGVGVPAGAVFDTMELQQDPSFEERGIMQVMEHPIRLDECVSIRELGPGARVPSPNARHHVKRETSREGGSP